MRWTLVGVSVAAGLACAAPSAAEEAVVTIASATFMRGHASFDCPISGGGETVPPLAVFALLEVDGERVSVSRYLTGEFGHFCRSQVAIVAETPREATVRLDRIGEANLPPAITLRLAGRRLRIGDPGRYVELACGSSADTTEEETASGVTSVTECSDQTVVVKAGRVSRIVRKKQDWEK